VGIAASLGAAACASVPPPRAEVATAEQSLRKAEQADAGHHAALDLRVARDKLEQAREAMQRGDHREARRLAEQANLDAQVAEARARRDRTQRAAAEIREQIEALQIEAERAGEMTP
jgi:hypothetical protein